MKSILEASKESFEGFSGVKCLEEKLGCRLAEGATFRDLNLIRRVGQGLKESYV